MDEYRFDVGVIVARRPIASQWTDHQWLPHTVLVPAPAAAPGTPLGAVGADELFYAGALELALLPSQTAHYRDNLASGQPSLWVCLQIPPGGGYVLSRVTADPYEGEALTGGIDGVVEAVPMPPAIATSTAAFVDAFHVEQPFIKRERKRADPDALGHRPPSTRVPPA